MMNIYAKTHKFAQLTNNQYITYNNKKYRTLKRLIISYLAVKIGKIEHSSKKSYCFTFLLRETSYRKYLYIIIDKIYREISCCMS